MKNSKQQSVIEQLSLLAYFRMTLLERSTTLQFNGYQQMAKTRKPDKQYKDKIPKWSFTHLLLCFTCYMKL